MWEKIQQAWKIKDVRNRLLFVIALLVIFRAVSHIPIPGVNVENLKNFLAGNQIFGLLDIFSGGTIQNFSIVMLGVAPYITASIIIQLLTMIVPRLEEITKEGESGQQKINLYTRWLTVPLAFLQSYGMIKLFSGQSATPILADLNPFRIITIMITVTAGTMFLVWLGEMISEKKVGNGVSLLIFAGIVSSLPGALKTAFINYNPSDLYTFILFGLVAVLTVVGVVFITEGQRNIPVNYAKQVRGNKMYGGVSTYLPLRVNQAGVIPIIFAISLLLFPQFFAQIISILSPDLSYRVNGIVNYFFNNQIIYSVLYFILVVIFTYFYTAITFDPDEISKNLQKSGGFIPGIRPGQATAEVISKTVHRITLFGAVFLGVIAILPNITRMFTGIKSLTLGGTGLLIVVAVALEVMKQIESQLTIREYDKF